MAAWNPLGAGSFVGRWCADHFDLVALPAEKDVLVARVIAGIAAG